MEHTAVPTAVLLVLQGVDQGKRVTVSGGPVDIGRGAENEIRILDTEVSRRHATLDWRDGHWTIADRDSSNGTFVNGVAVRTKQLSDGDQIQVGRTVLAFSDGESRTPPAVDEHINLVDEETADPSSIVGKVSAEAAESLSQRASGGSLGRLEPPSANLQTLYRISEEAVRPSLPLDTLLQRILDLTIEAVGADRGCMLVSDTRSDRIVPRVFRNRSKIISAEPMPVSTSIVNYVIAKGEGVWTSDARHDTRFEPGQSIVKAGIREAMCVPMQGRYELMGVIYVDTTTPSKETLDAPDRRRFSEELLTLLVAVGRQSALAVENNRYQQALVQAERLAAVGQTIASLSHHIKNILQGVRGGSYLIDMGLNQGQEELIRKGWDIVERNQDRIYNLVMDMLTFSKERQPKLAEADLNEVVGEVCDLVAARLTGSSVVLERRLSGELPESRFDAEGIHRAVLNVVTNAADVLLEREGEGLIVVETGCDRERDVLFVCVTDNGSGIPAEERQQIFELFESSKGLRGTGLGLAVSLKIIREHGGTIRVDSPPSGGSTFRIEWPVVPPAAAGTGPDGVEQTNPGSIGA